jgi:hypothetical protein
MNQIVVSKEQMINLLNKSFESGYNGYLDMKEDCVNSIFNEYLESQKVSLPKEFQPAFTGNGSEWSRQLSFAFDSNTLQNQNNYGNITLSTNY